MVTGPNGPVEVPSGAGCQAPHGGDALPSPKGRSEQCGSGIGEGIGCNHTPRGFGTSVGVVSSRCASLRSPAGAVAEPPGAAGTPGDAAGAASQPGEELRAYPRASNQGAAATAARCSTASRCRRLAAVPGRMRLLDWPAAWAARRCGHPGRGRPWQHRRGTGPGLARNVHRWRGGAAPTHATDPRPPRQLAARLLDPDQHWAHSLGDRGSRATGRVGEMGYCAAYPLFAGLAEDRLSGTGGR